MNKKNLFFNFKKNTNPNTIAASKIWSQLNEIQYQLNKKQTENSLKNIYIDILTSKKKLEELRKLELKEFEFKKIDSYIEKSDKLKQKISAKLDDNTIAELNAYNAQETIANAEEVSTTTTTTTTVISTTNEFTTSSEFTTASTTTASDENINYMNKNEDDLSENEKAALDLIKSKVAHLVNFNDITYKKYPSILEINYKNDPSKWICKLFLDNHPFIIHVFDEQHELISFDFEYIDDLNDIGEMFVNIVSKLI